MNIEIINIGDEILIGQVINTNAAWMAQELNKAGYAVNQFTVIGDTRDAILGGLHDAVQRADLVLVSGGLGPTKDDITKQTLCDFFGTKLLFDPETFRDLEKLFEKRGWHLMTESNRKQAELPDNCISLPNQLGTARGMWFETSGQSDERTNGRVFVFLPGVPFEMKEMMTLEVIPRLIKRFPPKAVIHKTILTQGKGESFIADLLIEWEENLPPHIKLAYLPQPGIVRLRLTASGSAKEILEKEVNAELFHLQKLIPDLIFGYGDDTLEAVTGRLLLQKNATLSIAESCTGGYVSHLITSIPGSSTYFKGGVVAYANDAKQHLLNVKEETLSAFGAVSEEVALEMAAGIARRLDSDYAIATTGIAGPSGGTAEKPVGTVWIGISTPEGLSAEHFLFGDNRERNIRRTAVTALNLLRKRIIGTT